MPILHLVKSMEKIVFVFNMNNLFNYLNNCKFLFVCLFLSLCNEICFSQTNGTSIVQYKGSIVDSKTSEPLSGTTITLHSLDGVLLAGTVCDENGGFEIGWQRKQENPKDSLVLLCSFMGYVTKSIQVPTSQYYDIGEMHLEETQLTIDEVTVSARRYPLKFDKGNYLAGVAGTSLAKLSSANDVLKRLPLLSGDNGSFSVRGRGQAIIFINRREVRDPSEIQNIDASQIESVKIITDPGVTYPIGTKAVIELTVKRWYKDYLGITFESEIYQRQRLSQYYTLRTNYSKKRLSLITLLRVSNPKFDPETDIEYTVSRPDGDLSYNVTGKSRQNSLRYSFDTGLNYDINDMQSLGFYMSASMSPRQTSYYDNTYRKDNVEIGSHTSKNKSENHGVNGTLYYIGKMAGININFQNYLYHSLNKGQQSLFLDNDNYFNMDSENKSFLYDSKLELGSKGPWGGDMLYGIQWTYTRRKDISSVLEGNVNNSNSLAVQNLLSPFFSYNWSYKNLSVSTGIRIEWEKRHFPNQNDSDTRQFYYNPKIGISYKFSNGLGASFNWQTFTSRPQYFVLSGISSMVYPFLYSTGNAQLKSTQNNNFYLNISYRDLFVQLKAKHIRNGVSVYYSFDYGLQVIKKTFENTPTHWEYGMAAIYQIKPCRFWTIDLFGELSYGSFGFGYEPERDYFNKPSYFIDITNRFDLGNGYTLNCYTGYSRTLNGIEESLGTGGISGSINKFFFGRKMYLSLNIGQYIQRRNRMRTAVDNIHINQLWDTSNRYIGLTFKYTFNTVSVKNKASQGNSSEIGRF